MEWTKRLKRYEEMRGEEAKGSDEIPFDDRICDDLCELILQFLSIEDKIKLSEVSKQFKTCLKNIRLKQKCLKVDNKSTNGRNNCPVLVSERQSANGSKKYEIDIERLTTVLETFPNINEIYFEVLPKFENKNEVLTTITENCNHLKAFSMDFLGCSQAVLKKFGLKFGQQLKTLEFFRPKAESVPAAALTSSVPLKPLTTFCSNLTEIRGIGIENLIENNEVLTKNLTKLSLQALPNLESFDLIVENCPKVTHLTTNPFFRVPNSDYNQFLSLVSKLTELKVLSIDITDNHSFDEELAKSIESIGFECKSLTTLDLRLNLKSFNARLGFESFEQFSNLKKLCFHSVSPFGDTYSDDKLDISCLNNCEQLTYLDVKTDQIDEDFLLGIHSVVPRLKYLSITTNTRLTDKTLNSIGKLKNLEVLELQPLDAQNPQKLNCNSMSDSGVLSLVFNCNNLHTIAINSKTSITDNTIDSLFEKAIEKRKINFSYYFKDIENRIDLNEFFVSNASLFLNNITINGMKTSLES